MLFADINGAGRRRLLSLAQAADVLAEAQAVVGDQGAVAWADGEGPPPIHFAPLGMNIVLFAMSA